MDILDLYLLRAYLLRWRVEDLLAGHDTDSSERAEGVISAAIAALSQAWPYERCSPAATSQPNGRHRPAEGTAPKFRAQVRGVPHPPSASIAMY